MRELLPFEVRMQIDFMKKKLIVKNPGNIKRSVLIFKSVNRFRLNML